MRYNRNRCTGCVRGEGKNVFGHKVIIAGIHAFEYSVTIITATSETIRRFPNGREARRYFAAIVKR